jgi:hypothetical protein
VHIHLEIKTGTLCLQPELQPSKSRKWSIETQKTAKNP